MPFCIDLNEDGLPTPVANLQRYLQDIERYPVLPNKEIIRLIERSRNQELSPDDRLEARHRIMLANQRLVVHIATKYARKGLGEVNDLIQGGNFGLDRAISKFRPELGHHFSTYAGWRIMGAIIRATHTVAEGRTIYIPPISLELMRRLKNMQALWLDRQGRLPEVSEVAEYFDIGKKGATSLIFDVDQDVKNWEKVSIDSEEAFDEAEAVADEGRISTEDRVRMSSLKSKIQELLFDLSPDDRFVLEYYFGLNGKPKLTLEAIGNELGYSRQNIQNKCNRMIRRFRQHHAQELSCFRNYD